MRVTEPDLKRLAALFAQQAIEVPPSETYRRSKGRKWEDVDYRRHRLLAGLDGVAELLAIQRGEGTE